MDLNIAEQAEKVTILSPPGLSGSYSQKSAGIRPKYDLMPGRESCRPSAPKTLTIELPRRQQLDYRFRSFWSRTPKQRQKRVPERVQNKIQKRHVLCRPPGAKMLYFGVHFTKSLPKVVPRLPKGSKNIAKRNQKVPKCL